MSRPPLPRRLPERRPRPELLFGVPRTYEKIHSGIRAVLAADPAKEEEFDRALAVGARGRGARDAARSPRRSDAAAFEEADRDDPAPGARAPRPRRPAGRGHRRRADPRRDPAVLPRPRCAALGDVRPLGVVGPGHLGTRAGATGHRRARDSRRRAAPRRRRRGAVPRRQRVPGLPRRPRPHGRGARRRRLAPHRRHRRARRRRLPTDRRPQEGADHHRRRQEHLARQPRSCAQGAAAHRAGVRGRRRPARSSSRSSCSIPTSRPCGRRSTASRASTLPELAARPGRAAPRSRARSTR